MLMVKRTKRTINNDADSDADDDKYADDDDDGYDDDGYDDDVDDDDDGYDDDDDGYDDGGDDDDEWRWRWLNDMQQCYHVSFVAVLQPLFPCLRFVSCTITTRLYIK